jgi:hypothetical protein
MRHLAHATLALAVATSASAAPAARPAPTARPAPAAKSTPAAKYTLRIKLMGPDAKLTYVPVVEVVRGAGGGVTVNALAAPAVDKLADELAARWKAWKPPASITITESIASDTGMQPGYQDHAATFTAKDKLYQAAVIRNFADKYGYDVLGMRSVHFIIYDSSAEWPPGANDRSSTRSNFRKNPDGLPYSNGFDSMYASGKVRALPAPGADGPYRASATDPQLTVDVSYDEGTLALGWWKLGEDGSIALEVEHPGDRIKQHYADFAPKDATVTVREHGEYKHLAVAKDSPWNLEAQLMWFEAVEHMDIVPAIDPVVFR